MTGQRLTGATRSISADMARNEEDRICCAYYAEACKLWPAESDALFHVPNGGKRALTTAKLFKRLGVTPGISDYFLAVPSGEYHGLWIEVKREGGTVSAEQKRWINLMRGFGYCAVVAYGYDECIEWTRAYLAEDGHALRLPQNTISLSDRAKWKKTHGSAVSSDRT